MKSKFLLLIYANKMYIYLLTCLSLLYLGWIRGGYNKNRHDRHKNV